MEAIIRQEPREPVPERTLQCLICGLLPEEAVSCRSCRKIFCWMHIKELANSCYNCEASPLGILCETELQPLINSKREERQKVESSKKTISCKAYKCEFMGDYASMLGHQKIKHPELDMNQVVFGVEHSSEKELYLESKSNRVEDRVELKPVERISREQLDNVRFTEEDRRIARFASIPRANELPAGQRKKVPTEEKALAMVAHTKLCRSQKCRQLWVGPWGAFIGGEQGSSHFDFATCFEGRSLNQSIGWNYLSPRE